MRGSMLRFYSRTAREHREENRPEEGIYPIWPEKYRSTRNFRPQGTILKGRRPVGSFDTGICPSPA